MVNGSLIMSQKAEIDDAFKEFAGEVRKAAGNPDRHTKHDSGTVATVDITLSDKTVNTIMEYLERLLTKADERLRESQCDELI